MIGIVAAEHCHAALGAAPLAADAATFARAFWPEGEGPDGGARRVLHGRRAWRVGVHAAQEVWREGQAPVPPDPAS